MFHQLHNVIKTKNRVQREQKQRRRNEINELREDMIFRAKLQNDLKLVSLILSDPNVESIDVETSNKDVTNFDSAMYNSEMSEYNVIKNGNQYNLSSREIDIGI